MINLGLSSIIVAVVKENTHAIWKTSAYPHLFWVFTLKYEIQ